MTIDDEAGAAEAGRRDGRDRGADERGPRDEQREKVIVRSDGTVTYVGKDMAYQLWKFGLLGKDFYYRVFARAPTARRCGRRRSDPAAAAADHPAFGGASMVCNVIDTRQAYLQKLLKQALAALGYQRAGASDSVHYSYEMVALSHAPRASSDTTRARTPASRSSRCRGARDSASRRTTCSTA